ncbi:ferrochelatase [Neisseria lactamica]|uniref:ferrochelatase n=1 Tax=Neisseria lactamica TaxID=486 RepID=UPI0001972BCE|nr:ferrochelatase [Neisseria lactamica]
MPSERLFFQTASRWKANRVSKGLGNALRPCFLSNCLETLEETAPAGCGQFYEAGGKNYRYIPCLNDHPDRIGALERLVKENLGGGY